MSKLRTDEKGVVAIEMALLLPLFVACIGWAIDIGELIQIRQATQFASMSAAASGARALNQEAGAVAKAQSIAQATFTANAPLFLKNTTATFGGCVAYDASGAETGADDVAISISCRVSATAPPLFPIAFPTISQSAEARS